jgi:lipid II:glycine glycyltransferase (peptidoglycan interpeptide bridge formation enzyme)
LAAAYTISGSSGDLNEDNPLYGLYRFKRGFNGDFCEFLGEFDYVTNPLSTPLSVSKKNLNYVMTKRYMLKNGIKPPG